jgi:glycosyltransferase involved in cell wall biosynthesis
MNGLSSPHLVSPSPQPGPWLSVVLPCYNESEVIGETYRRLTAVCGQIGRPYELILVNDGSSDETWPKMLRLTESDPLVVAINLSRNHGHQTALSAGLHFTCGERILIMDADLQDPPELLPAMLQQMDAGADVVYAQRRSRPGDAPVKRLFCAVYYRLLRWLASTHIPLDTGDFRLISRRVRDVIVAMPERQRFIRGMVSWVGFRQEPILYDRDARFAGESKYPLHKLMALAIDGILSSSCKPLKLALPLGVGAVLSSLAFGVYALVSHFFISKTPQGWSSLLCAIAFFGGLQLIVLGVLGEYIGRIHEQIRGRPLFLVDAVVRSNVREASDKDRAGLRPLAPAPASEPKP